MNSLRNTNHSNRLHVQEVQEYYSLNAFQFCIQSDTTGWRIITDVYTFSNRHKQCEHVSHYNVCCQMCSNRMNFIEYVQRIISIFRWCVVLFSLFCLRMSIFQLFQNLYSSSLWIKVLLDWFCIETTKILFYL